MTKPLGNYLIWVGDDGSFWVNYLMEKVYDETFG
jgi:hypothetical protein